MNPQDYLDAIVLDLHILEGSQVGPPDASWQDVAGTAVATLRALAQWLQDARAGQLPGPVVMPSISEAMDKGAA